MIRYREGDVVGGHTLTGSIEGAYLADNGEVAYTWDIVEGAGNVEALFLDDKLILKEGDLVDWDGDGFVDIDAILEDFTGISALTSGPGWPVGVHGGHRCCRNDPRGVLHDRQRVPVRDTYSVSVSAGGSQVLTIDAVRVTPVRPTSWPEAPRGSTRASACRASTCR